MVCHSLGGILAKEMLRTSNECADDGWKLIAEQTRLAVFMATPHTGASLASAVKLIAPRLASTHVDLLSNDSGYLTSLNQSYRDLANGAGIATVSYYEKFKTGDVAIVVSPESSDPGVGATRPVAVDADHLSICKPAGRSDLIYASLCRHLRGILKECPLPASSIGSFDSFAPDDYGASSETDRRDLLQKLIDAGREYEYQKANDLQNKFAQRYYKLGLHTEAKKKNDAVLSAVEQRFTTHVYGGKICKGATDEEIASALQMHVIDPMCGGTGHEQLSPTAILQALYFLTEQCYIQWDAT
jgi:protein SERAC1